MSVISQPKLSPPRKTSPAPEPRVAPLDLLIVLGLAVLTPLAWLVPERWWPTLGRGALWPLARLFPRWSGGLAEPFARCGGHRLPRPPRTLAVRALSRYVETNLQVLKAYRPWGRPPEVDLRGLEHLEAALARGRGAVLWVSHFHFYPLVSKLGLDRAGHAVSHLSHPRHGFSRLTWFGRSFLNPIHTAAEDRHLRERVLLPLEGKPKEAMGHLRRRLAAGGVVSITARETGRRPLVAPFLEGELRLAAGAPYLAHGAGAALLPVHTIKEGPGRFTLTIEPPLALDGDAPRAEALAAAARDYAARLEALVLAHPDQWQGWFHL